MGGFNPFYRPELASVRTPAERVGALRAVAAAAPETDAATAEKLVIDLVRQVETEPNPLVRQAILETVSQFNTPVAQKAPIAGLQDDDPHVRQACCRLLAQRPSADGAAALAGVAKQDVSLDVRMAAIRSLGEQDTSIAQPALLAALEDGDPAMQLVGVNAMKRLTGRDLGGDVAAYIAMAKGAAPSATPSGVPASGPGGEESPTAIADRRFGWLPK